MRDWAESLVDAEQDLKQAMHLLALVLPGGMGTNQLLDKAERHLLQAHRHISHVLGAIERG